MSFPYPKTHTSDVVDDFHGTLVPDPYRWLEDPNSVETKAFITAQNALTQDFLSDAPNRDSLRGNLETLLDFPKYATPQKVGKRYFYNKNDGLQNQPVLYVKNGETPSRPLLDPNTLSPDGTVALITQSLNKDGALLGYSLSQSGSDLQIVKVRDTETGEDLTDEIHHCRFTNIAWVEDSTGFYYNRYPEPGSVSKEDETNYCQIYFHKLGTDQSEDELIYERPDDKEINSWPYISDDGMYLVISEYQGTDRRLGLSYCRLDSDEPIQTLLPHKEAAFRFVGNKRSTFYILTDLDAPNGRIIAIDVENPGRENWRTLVAEREDAIDVANIVNGQFIIRYQQHARHRLKIFNLDGSFDKEIHLPTMGSVTWISGKGLDREMLFVFTSFLYPPTIYKYDFVSGELVPQHEPALPVDLSEFETTQEFYTSKDGTRVPMFLTYKKGVEKNAKNPTILYGYGGYTLSQLPAFTPARLSWVAQGGIFALANIRGGSEYGEEWHRQGMLENKQNVFDDFIAAAEWLIENKYTCTKHLAIEGRSNGGLLVAACMLQRPDLFGAVLCHVGVHDVLRFHKFTVGRYWVPEMGNAEENADDFEYIYKYSPLHNVEEGATYPPILITTADTDDRVVPAHSLKFGATLQAKAPSSNPTLLRVEVRAGHGMGKPISKVIDELADIQAFLRMMIG